MKIKNLKTSKKGTTVNLTFWQEVRLFFGIKHKKIKYTFQFEIETAGDLEVGDDVIAAENTRLLVIERLSENKFVLLAKELHEEEPILGDDIFVIYRSFNKTKGYMYNIKNIQRESSPIPESDLNPELRWSTWNQNADKLIKKYECKPNAKHCALICINEEIDLLTRLISIMGDEICVDRANQMIKNLKLTKSEIK